MKVIAMCFVLAAAASLSIQDPVKPPGEPPGEPAAVTGKAVRDPLEGVYRLRTRVVAGAPDPKRHKGYVAITGRHMLLVLAGAGSDPEHPLLRAGVRTWRKKKTGVETVIEVGFFTDEDGAVHVEEPGSHHVRRIDVIRGMLRIWQDERSYLEFERLE